MVWPYVGEGAPGSDEVALISGKVALLQPAMCATDTSHLPSLTHIPMLLEMFVVTETDAAAIRAVFDQEGELSAAIELRRRLLGITDNAKARACARTIAGWTPVPDPPRPVTRLRPRRDR